MLPAFNRAGHARRQRCEAVVGAVHRAVDTEQGIGYLLYEVARVGDRATQAEASGKLPTLCEAGRQRRIHAVKSQSGTKFPVRGSPGPVVSIEE